MPWFRLDDQGAFGAKVMMAGNEAYGAWCRAGQWSSAHGTDGKIPAATAHGIGPERLWKKLINAKPPGHEFGLVEPIEGGYMIHDFLDWNPSSEEVAAERDRKRRNVSAFRASRAAVTGYTDITGQEQAGVLPSCSMVPDPRSLPEEEMSFLVSDRVVPDPVVPDRIREVFDHWIAGWKRAVGGKNPPKLSEPRRVKIRARLAEGYTVDQIKTAIDAVWGSSFHVEKGHYDVELVCRSSTKLDWFLAQTEGATPTPAPRVVKALGETQTLSLMDRLAARPAEAQ